MRIEPFTADHLRGLALQPSQALMQRTLGDPAYGAMLASSNLAWTAFDDDDVLACMGLIPMWEHRAYAWGLLAVEAGRHLLGITRAVWRTMELHPFRRIETTVRADFVEGHRWARLLGFEREGALTAYAPDGATCDMYARIRWKQC
jgi:hypothetical protein